ncbi:MAG: hypothetical protein HY961_11775 [Ignavibacteriae bacterium]|nr:hypothetical protein [Ignavibacteriota bacterium]
MRTSFVVVLILLSSAAAHAQRAATSTIKNFSVNSGNYSFDVHSKSTGAQTISVGTSSLYFTYNSAGITNPVLSNINPRFNGLGGPTDDYGPMTVGIYGGQIGVTIQYLGNMTTGAQLFSAPSDSAGERICTVSLTITNPQASSQLAWSETNSAILHSATVPVSQTFVGSDNRILPVQLAHFTAQYANGNPSSVILSWKTISEINNYGFEIQKSQDAATNFQTIQNSFTPGHGTTNQPQHYSYTDQAATSGVWYYRLKQIDLDGTVHFTEPIVVGSPTSVKEREMPTTYALDQNYPNPFNPTTTVEFAVPKESNVRLEVYNILGERVATLVDENVR